MIPLKDNLPSNKKFGFFISFILLLFILYNRNNYINIILLSFLAFIFLYFSIFNSDKLYTLNLLWYKFGLIIGSIISPICLGIIFFGLITPLGLIVKLFGRDPLNLRQVKLNSYWKKRDDNETNPQSFHNQF
jgi:hypothetical protein